MKRFFFAILALFAIAAQADPISIGNASGKPFPCSGNSRFCRDVPNTGALSIPMIYTYAGNPGFVEMTIDDAPTLQTDTAAFGALIPIPGDPNCGEKDNGLVYNCAFQSVSATFADGTALKMVMYTYTLRPRVSSGKGGGAPRQFWFIQSGTLVMP